MQDARNIVAAFLGVVAVVAATFVATILAGHEGQVWTDWVFIVWVIVLALSLAIAVAIIRDSLVLLVRGGRPVKGPRRRRSSSSTQTGKGNSVMREQLFVCYDPADERWLTRLLVNLKPLEQSGLIDTWSERRLIPGDVRQEKIENALDRAKIALLLVSADFLASDHISDFQLPRLLTAAEEGGCRIITILVGPSLYEESPLARYAPANPGGPPLSQLAPADSERVLVELARTLIGLLKPEIAESAKADS